MKWRFFLWKPRQEEPLYLRRILRKSLHVGPSNSCHQNSIFLNPYAPKIFAIVVFDVPAADDIVCSAMLTQRPENCFVSKPIVPPRAALLHRARLKLCANLQDTYCVLHLRLDREDNKIPKRHSPVQVLFRTLFWNWGSIAHVIQNRVQPMAPNFFAIVVFS